MKTTVATTIVTVCLMVVLSAVPAGAGDTEASYGIRLSAGYDSNPLLVTKFGQVPSGVFSQLRLNGGVTGHTGSTVSLFASGFAGTRLDESDNSDAGDDSGGVRAGLILIPRFSGQRLALSLGGGYSIYRGTFTDNKRGEVYEASVAPSTTPPSTIPIPDRLNHDTAGVFLKLRWRQNDRFRLALDSTFDRASYVEDYGNVTNLSPLDYRSFNLRPGADLQIGDAVSLRLSVSLTDLDYDERFALDEVGDEVAGTVRSYRYVDYNLIVRVIPAESWVLRLGLTGGGRDDLYAGYYDYSDISAFLGVDHEFGPKSRLQLYTSASDTDYDTATVSGDPADAVLGSSEQLYMVRFDRSFGERLRWFVEGGTRQRENQDPDFTYDRDWVLCGIYFGR